MKLTANKVNAILQRHENLVYEVERFVQQKHPNTRRGEVRISNGVIEEHVNTACHCHPEYEWVERATLDEFTEWLDKQTT
jgi:hypothetical protein